MVASRRSLSRNVKKENPVTEKNVMAASSSCGDHGIPKGKYCLCDEGWRGNYCSIPPPSTTACVVSSNRSAYGGGDKDCGNYGTYGACNIDGTCTCDRPGIKHPFSGTRCEQPSTSDAGCGAVDGSSVPIGRYNQQSGQCECLRAGWSGVQCRDVDPFTGFRCTKNEDCGWGSEYTSLNVCDTSSGLCVCAKNASGSSLFTGNFCEHREPARGDTCAADSDCISDQKCNVDRHVCEGGGGGGKDESFYIKFLTAIDTMFQTPQGLEQLSVFVGAITAKKIVQKMMVEPAYAAYLKNQALKQGEKYLESDAFKKVSESVSKDVMADVVAKQVSKEVFEAAVDQATKKIAEEAAAKMLTLPFGEMFDFLMWMGMAIDILDPDHLNTQMTQSSADYVMNQLLYGLNNQDVLKELNIGYPRRYSPEEGVEFNLLMNNKEFSDKNKALVAEYINALALNSNGQLIQPYVLNDAGVSLQEKKKKYKLLWSMSKGSDVVFKRWLKYGWVLLVVVIVALAALGLALGLIFHKKKK